ncbi:MAG TPA: M15 family metallopeptidase [Actinomycetota bacterium]|nr:M15 family metallopeptidase [Actinomycetota bacterium]
MALLDPPSFGGWGDPCRTATMATVEVDDGLGHGYSVPWRQECTRPFLRAFARVKAGNIDRKRLDRQTYPIRMLGTYSCRDATCCPGKFSNHAFALALDINWDVNPFHGSTSSWGPHDVPIWVIRCFEAEGFHWLAQYDPMHFERLQPAGCEPIGDTGPTAIDHRQFLTTEPEEALWLL